MWVGDMQVLQNISKIVAVSWNKWSPTDFNHRHDIVHEISQAFEISRYVCPIAFRLIIVYRVAVQLNYRVYSRFQGFRQRFSRSFSLVPRDCFPSKHHHRRTRQAFSQAITPCSVEVTYKTTFCHREYVQRSLQLYKPNSARSWSLSG